MKINSSKIFWNGDRPNETTWIGISFNFSVVFLCIYRNRDMSIAYASPIPALNPLWNGEWI